MRKLILLSGIAVVAMSACTKTEYAPVSDKGAQIVFNSPIVQLNSKAGYYGEEPTADGKYSISEKFSVYAVWTSGDFVKWTDGTKYMNNVEVAYNSSLASNPKGGWEPATTYYWPKNGKLTFAGYSPSDLKTTSANPQSDPIISYGAAGLSVSGFEVDPNPANQFDFMYSERSYNRTSSTNQSSESTDHTYQSYDGVDLLFHHALSSIVFKVKADNSTDAPRFKLKKIEVNNVNYRGDFTENINEEGTAYASSPSWTVDGSETNYTAWSGEQEIDSKDFSSLNNASALILLPQSFKHTSTSTSVKVAITYDVTTNGVTLKDQTAEFDLSNSYKDKNNNVISAWEMGKRYIYKIYFALNKIYFSPEVDKWDEIEMGPFEVI